LSYSLSGFSIHSVIIEILNPEAVTNLASNTL
jgi:hypothetical protein